MFDVEDPQLVKRLRAVVRAQLAFWRAARSVERRLQALNLVNTEVKEASEKFANYCIFVKSVEACAPAEILMALGVTPGLKGRK